MLCQTKIVRIITHFFAAVFRDPEIVFQTKSSAAGPVNSGLDCQHHPLPYRAGSCLVCVRRFVRPRADSMANRMRWLSRISTFSDTRANQSVEFGKAGTVARKRNTFVEDLEKKIEQLVILKLQFAGAGVFREVGPVAVGAYPDLE